MAEPDKLIRTLIEKFSTDPEFKDRFLCAIQADPEKVVSEVEDILLAEGIEVNAEAHKMISEINWQSKNLGEELNKRISRTRSG